MRYSILMLLATATGSSAAAVPCSLAARLSGGEIIKAGDSEARVIRALGPPDRIISGSASEPARVVERLVYYLPDAGQLEVISFEVNNGRVLQICEQRETR